jgi:preprotein translocase subunit SecG
VRRGTEFIEKATWGLAIALIVLSILMAPKDPRNVSADDEGGSVTKRKAQTAVSVPQQQPQQAQPQPAQQPPPPAPAGE